MNKLIKNINYLLIILLLSVFNYVSAYTMPTGIPDTDIDFTQDAPVRPSDWSRTIAGYYYINASTGSNSNVYGTPTAPRASIPSPIPAGSYVEISGTYPSNTAAFFINGQGTEDTWEAGVTGPVWVTTTEVSDGTFKALTVLIGTNVFLDGLSFRDGGSLHIGSYTTGTGNNNIVARNNSLVGTGDVVHSGIIAMGTETIPTTNTIIYNNTISNYGPMASTGDSDATGIDLKESISNTWILSNDITACSGAGVQVGPTGKEIQTHNTYIGLNHIYGVRQSGIGVKWATNTVISTNHVHDIISTSWSVSKGIAAQAVPVGVWFINNHIHGMEYGIRLPSTQSSNTAYEYYRNQYIIGNVIYDIRPVQPYGATNAYQSAGINSYGSDQIWIYNNLIFDAFNGISKIGWIPVHMKNNIILDVTPGFNEAGSGYHIWALEALLNTNYWVENNYFGSGMRVRDGNSTIYTTPAALNALPGASGNVAGDDFITLANIDALIAGTSITSLDYSLLTDAGANVDEILTTAFTAAFPMLSSVDSDMFGMNRIQGSGIDIGPFESSSVKQVTGGTEEDSVPMSPSNLIIDTQ
ncbi:hypothetical protein [Psychromonas sp.]|uniref:hypothetical protein n=1 Tax=Psychromonas sp. TaxID=1884585 RepID=UPI0039E4700F